MTVASNTPLTRELHGAMARRPTPLDAFRLARRRFVAGGRIEMQALSDEIGTSRVTVHRWVGSRDQLLAEILWSLAEPTLRDARAATRRRGGAGIAEAFGRFLQAVHDAPFMQRFLEREPEIALRVLTTKSSPVQARLVAVLRSWLADEVAAGRIDPPLELEDLAYIMVRLGESFVYTDTITGGQPDPGKARQAIAALLR